MLYLKFYFFIRKAKWEKRDSDTFFNKEKGITLTVYDRSDRRVINVKTDENSSLEYTGIPWWFTKRFFKKIDNKIKRQAKKEERIAERKAAKEYREQNANRLISALNRQCYVEIEYDRDNRTEYNIKEWLEQKEYSYEKLDGATRRTNTHIFGASIYYFVDKSHATEFKMVFGGEH